MNTNLMPLLFPNDIVHLRGREDTLYKIIRTKQVKAIVEDEFGKRWELRMPDCVKVEDRSRFTEAIKDEVEETKATMALGGVVRYKAGTGNARRYPGMYVIAWDLRGETVRLVKLGGDGHRYMTGVPLTSLEDVPDDEVTLPQA